MKCIFVSLALVSAVCAQEANRASNAIAAAAEERRELHRAAAARALAGNLDDAEAALELMNFAKPGTPEWRIETAHRLTSLVPALLQEGRPDAVMRVANRALAHLRHVERADNAPGHRISALMAEAGIYERFVGDVEGAASCYRAVLQLNAKQTAAAEGLRRLQAMTQDTHTGS